MTHEQKTAVLLIGFGGPTRPEEVKPFLMSVVGGMKVPPERLAEVLRHYEVIGGVSPFNAITQRQKNALEAFLLSKGISIPVSAAYRHSTPSFKDAFESYKHFGVERVIGFILASFRSSVSFKRYVDRVEEGRREAGADTVIVEYTEPFFHDELYLNAQAERINEIWGTWTPEKKAATEMIFTAHSIPTAICEASCGENDFRCYGYQFHEAARHISSEIGAKNWRVAYQSRSGNPHDPWLEPDIKDTIGTLNTKKVRNVLVVPVGFLCDNAEVIYDLDHEAKAVAEDRGLGYYRAGTVSDHPIFIEMIAKNILEKLEKSGYNELNKRHSEAKPKNLKNEILPLR